MHRIVRTIPALILFIAISLGSQNNNVVSISDNEPPDDETIDQMRANDMEIEAGFTREEDEGDEMSEQGDDEVDHVVELENEASVNIPMEEMRDIEAEINAGFYEEEDVEVLDDYEPDLSQEYGPSDEEILEYLMTSDADFYQEGFIEIVDDPEPEITQQEQEQQYNPMGLQTWSDENEFIQALVGGRLVLVIITSSSCNKGKEIMQYAVEAAASIDELFASPVFINSIFGKLSLDPSALLTKPLIGVMDSETVPSTLIESLGGVTAYPTLKCVLTFPDIEQSSENSGKDDTDEDIVMWDYIGQKESAYDLFESVLMYWYRFVLSNALEGHRKHVTAVSLRSPVFSFGSVGQLGDFLQLHGEMLMRPAHPRFKQQSKHPLLSEVFDFLMGGKHRDFSGVLHTLARDDGDQNHQCMNDEQIDDGDCNETSEITQEIDPYILLIQCRTTKVKDENLPESELKAKLEFDELAEEMTHRRDVAFFSLLDEPICNKWADGIETGSNGAVLVIRARRYVSYSVTENLHENDGPRQFPFDHRQIREVQSIKTSWEEALQNPPDTFFDVALSALFEKEFDDKATKMSTSEDPMDASDFVSSKLVPFIITETTPTVLWFDRHRTAQLAFPWYRKTHAVLVLDIGLNHQQLQTSSTSPSVPTSDSNGVDILEEPMWPSKLNRSLAAAQLLSDQQQAIQLFYNAALSHRVKHPFEDVVFLIIPSSETRILTKFGIDIWTGLDEALFPSKQQKKKEEFVETDNVGYCSSGISKNRNILPVMILTDNSHRSGIQSSRRYMCSGDILATSEVSPEEGGPIAQFLDSFMDGTIEKPFVRSDDSQPSNVPWYSNKNQANVTVLTGNSFESLVMERKDSHSMLLMQSITCGHCKRFSILWNEFSNLIQAMNWGDVIEVMKIDVSKNDVPHDKVEVWDVPSVYYFPAFEKDNPIEVTWVGPKVNPQHDYDEGLSWIRSGTDLVEWIIRQGKLDIELLIRLDESKNKPQHGSVKDDTEPSLGHSNDNNL